MQNLEISNSLLSSIESHEIGLAIFEYHVMSAQFILKSANSIYKDILIPSDSFTIGKSISELFPTYLIQQIESIIIACKDNKQINNFEFVIEYEGVSRWWNINFSPEFSEDTQTFLHMISTSREITKNKRITQDLEMMNKRFDVIILSAYDGIITINENQNITMMNNSAKEIFGYDDTDMIGQPLTVLMPIAHRGKHPVYVKGFEHSLINTRAMQERKPVNGLKKDGTEFPLEVTISKLKVGDKIEMTALIRDISERMRLIDELTKLTREDELTGIKNRTHFQELIHKEYCRYKRYKETFTVIMFDLDHFKNINDTYGHDCGDLVLKSISNLVSSHLRNADTFARWGGEEFIMLLPETSLRQGGEIAEKLRIAIEGHDINYDNQKINITASFGVSSIDDHYKEIDLLIKKADDNLYSAKHKGRNTVIS